MGAPCALRLVRPAAVAAVCLCFSACSLWPFGNKEPESEPAVAGENMPDQVIDPNIERRAIPVPAIDSEDYEVGAFVGTLSTTRDNALGVFGVRAGMFFHEDFFAEWSAQTSISGKNDTPGVDYGTEVAVDALGLSLGYHLMPMELFNGDVNVIPAWIYLLGGASSVSYDDDSFVGMHFAIGMRVLPADHWSVRVEIRNEVWPGSGTTTTTSSQGVTTTEEAGTVNLEYTLGVSYHF